MLIISHLSEQCMDKFGEADKAFQEAQLLRKKTLLSYMEAGKALSQIRQGLEPATKTKPVETDLGPLTIIWMVV